VPCGSAESAGPASNAFEAGTGDVESASRESCYVERFQNVAAMVNVFAGAMVNLFTRCEVSLRSTAGLASNRLAGVESISGGTQAERVSKRLRVARFSRCRVVCGVRRTGRCRVDTARVSQKSHHVEESSSGGGFVRVCVIDEACKCVRAINEACKSVCAVKEACKCVCAINEACKSVCVVNEACKCVCAINEACKCVCAVNEACKFGSSNEMGAWRAHRRQR